MYINNYIQYAQHTLGSVSYKNLVKTIPVVKWFKKVVLGTCAAFSATAPLARTEKGGACRGGACRGGANKINSTEKMALICAIFKPNFAKNLDKCSVEEPEPVEPKLFEIWTSPKLSF